ncbi:MAG: crossover junction endodeoxyribonuclease RuvC [Pyrinomonadaceae bacterium]
MRVLGIDPGSETLGWGVVEGSGLKYTLIDFGTVRSSPGQQFSKRLLNVYKGVDEIVDRYSPDVLAVEDTFYAVNVGVALKLGQVRGTMLLLAEQRGIEIAEYSPRLIKQTVVGYGNAEKTQVQEMVRILLRLKAIPQPHDASDALAIAICHFHHAGMKSRIESAKGRSPGRRR